MPHPGPWLVHVLLHCVWFWRRTFTITSSTVSQHFGAETKKHYTLCSVEYSIINSFLYYTGAHLPGIGKSQFGSSEETSFSRPWWPPPSNTCILSSQRWLPSARTRVPALCRRPHPLLIPPEPINAECSRLGVCRNIWSGTTPSIVASLTYCSTCSGV